jgi:ATPase family associated with various cellular activities (AAA)
MANDRRNPREAAITTERAAFTKPQQAPATFKKLNREDMQNMDATTAAVRFLMERMLIEEDRKAQGERFKNVEAQVRWAGSEITLPENPTRMNFAEARDWLSRLEKSDQENIAVNEVIDAFPFDGAIAMMKALKQVYGWATPVPPQKFFEEPPTTMSVDISPTERVQIIWGRFAIPGIEGTLMTGVDFKHGRPVFTIQGEVRKKHVQAISEIAELTRKIVAEESIYRGKPVKLSVDQNGNLNLREAPTFVDVSHANIEELIFSDSLMEQITTNLFTPIIHAEVCRQNQIPLKRGILMEGPYGTGKTLCAFITAQIAQEHGWTFITIDRVTALKAALNFGVLYQPCVIFCEDIDRETAGERTPELDDILNVIDGIGSKDKEIMVVLTSNEAEKINRAMMRPGRLDAVISIQAPDKVAAERLMRLYARGLIAVDVSLDAAASTLQGQIPAVIRECVERAKLYAISRSHGTAINLVDADLVRAAEGMKHHLELLAGKPPDNQSDEHKLGAALTTLVQKGIGQTNGEMLYEIAEQTNVVVEAIRRRVGA